MKKQITIGNITRVRWHYVYRKYALESWGHIRETFDENSYIIKQHPHLETATIIEMDDSMKTDKFYAYIYIDKDKDSKLHIRNLFDSKHEKEFSQKNTFFVDEIYYDLFLDDTSNLLDTYLQLGNETKDNNRILHFCVEYEPTTNIDLDLLIYCSELEHIKCDLENKLRLIDIQNDLKTNKAKKSLSFFW